MHVTIEDNEVVENLDKTEFPKFEAMFDNLQDNKHMAVEYRDFPGYNGETMITLLHMHLCWSAGPTNSVVEQ